MIDAYKDERPNGLNQHDSLHWSLLNLQQMRIWSFLMLLRSHIEPVTEIINGPNPCCHCGCHIHGRGRRHLRLKRSQTGKRAESFVIKSKLLLTLELWFGKVRGIEGEHWTKTCSSAGTAQCWDNYEVVCLTWARDADFRRSTLKLNLNGLLTVQIKWIML